MSLKKTLSLLSFAILLILVTVVVLNFRNTHGTGAAGDEHIVGKGLNHKVYDESQKLSAEITSVSSVRDFDRSREPAQRERTLLNTISGVIYKGKKFSSDLRFSGNSGYVENDYQNFLLKDNARVESDELTLTSDNFFMEANSLISNKTTTRFVLKTMEGIAKGGMNYHMKLGVINLLKAAGTYIRNGEKYHFKCNRLMVLNKFNRVVFMGNAQIKSVKSTMRGKEIILKFNAEFKNLLRTDIRGKGYFYTTGDRPGDSREMKGNKIIAVFDENENINKIDITKNGIVKINSKKSRMEARSDLLYIRFDHRTTKLKFVKLMKKGRVIASGKRSFDVSSKRIRVFYDEKGDISQCNTTGDTVFTMDEYTGSTPKLSYAPPEDRITLEGEKSELRKGNNRFESPEFIVNTREEKLSSDKEIRSVVSLKSENSIFSKSPVFISSKKIEIDESSGTVTYSDSVMMFQEKTRLSADTVKIGDNKTIVISGNGRLTFTNSEKEISVSGGVIGIDPDKDVLNIDDKAVINDGENLFSGKSLIVEFGGNNEIRKISGDGNIEFKRGGISGKSQKAVWKFSDKVITFLTNARLIKTDSGTSVGEEIQFFIEDERVVVKSAPGKRSETKID